MTDSKAANSQLIDALVADVLEAAGALRRHGDRQAARVGQTQARWQVLSALSAGPRTVPAAARRLGITRQAVQRVVDLLAAERLIASDPNPDHASSPLYSLTPEGRSALAALSEENEVWNRSVSRELGEREVERGRELLRKLIRLSGPA